MRLANILTYTHHERGTDDERALSHTGTGNELPSELASEARTRINGGGLRDR